MHKQLRGNTPRRQEPDLIEKSSFSNSQPYFSRPIAWQHTFYIAGVIGSANSYAEWFEVIRTAGPDDIVNININSMGGEYATALQFRRVMMESPATIVCSIEGECHSAASLIYLSGDSFSVSEGSSMLCHDYSGMAMGKGSEMLKMITHEKVSIDNFLKDVYSEFLTEQEINNVLSGQDLWLDDTVIIERTQKMVEFREKEVQDYMNQEEEEDEPVEVIPEKKKSRSRKK